VCLQALKQDHLSENIKKTKNKIKKDERKKKYWRERVPMKKKKNIQAKKPKKEKEIQEGSNLKQDK
jgi:hypothetical protein